jgi:hypothetical protein
MNTAFMGESDPSLNYCTNTNLLANSNNYYDSNPSQQETVLLASAEGEGQQQQHNRSLNSSMLMTSQHLIHNSQLHYTSVEPTTCGQTIIQSYPVPATQQEQLQQQNGPVYSQMSYSTNYCTGPSSTSSSPPMTMSNGCHDQVED